MEYNLKSNRETSQNLAVNVSSVRVSTVVVDLQSDLNHD